MEKYRNDPTRWLSMPAFAMPDYSDLTHVFSDLAFLLETEHVQALMDLSINQENFDQAIKTVELRSKFLVEEVQPRASTLQMAGKTFNESELVNHFGEHLFYGAVNYATAVFEHLDSAVNFNFDTHRKIHRAAKDMFPESKFASHNKEEAVNGP